MNKICFCCKENKNINEFFKDEYKKDKLSPLCKICSSKKAKFDLTNREKLLRACHFTNMQPLWAIDNLIKSDKALPEE